MRIGSSPSPLTEPRTDSIWETSLSYLLSGDYDLVVLDEPNIALRYQYLDAQEVVEWEQGGRHQGGLTGIGDSLSHPALYCARKGHGHCR